MKTGFLEGDSFILHHLGQGIYNHEGGDVKEMVIAIITISHR